MSRYPIVLKPQGVIPRDLSLTLQLQPVVSTKPEAPAVSSSCVLGIATLSPVATDSESFFTVFASEIQASDLEVVVTLVDAGSPLAIAFLGTGSPPAFDSASVTAIIQAGSDYVIVPFLAGPDAIGSPALTITATSASCGSASTQLEIEPCVSDITDVTYRLEWRTLTPSVTPPAVATSGASVAYFGSVGVLAEDTNAWTSDSFPIPTEIIVVCEVIGKVCPTDQVAFQLTRTGGNLWTKDDPVSDDPRSKGAIIQAWGDPWAHGVISPPFAHGDTLVITAHLNGVLIDHPRATFTITIG